MIDKYLKYLQETKVTDDNPSEEKLKDGAKIITEEEPDIGTIRSLEEILVPFIPSNMDVNIENIDFINMLSEDEDMASYVIENLINEEHAYHQFFRDHLKRFGASKLGGLTKEKKSLFFRTLKKAWQNRKGM
jgi:hypothetical protein